MDFSRGDMDAPIHQLSGGWLLRLFIATTLLNEPDILLLDEPTNHLDISSIQWLEEFLQKEYEGSLVLVTHDVALQKRVTDSLVLLHASHFYFHKHQHDYLSFRDSVEEDQRIIEKHLEELDRKIGENQQFVDRYRAKARIASRAQSKAKAIEDMHEEKKTLQERLNLIRGFSYHSGFVFAARIQGKVSHFNGAFEFQIRRFISLDIEGHQNGYCERAKDRNYR